MSAGTERVRVVRLLEYTGPRDEVERQLGLRYVRGTRHVNASTSIREAMLGDFPEAIPEVDPTSYERHELGGITYQLDHSAGVLTAHPEPRCTGQLVVRPGATERELIVDTEHSGETCPIHEVG